MSLHHDLPKSQTHSISLSNTSPHENLVIPRHTTSPNKASKIKRTKTSISTVLQNSTTTSHPNSPSLTNKKGKAYGRGQETQERFQGPWRLRGVRVKALKHRTANTPHESGFLYNESPGIPCGLHYIPKSTRLIHFIQPHLLQTSRICISDPSCPLLFL